MLSALDALLANWAAVLASYAAKHGDLQVFLAGMTVAHETAFILTNAFYLLVSRIPSLLRYKLQDQKADPSAQQVWGAIRHVYLGRVAFQLPATVGYFHLWRACGGNMAAPAPTARTALWQLGLMGITMEVLFYSLHRLFHSRWLYRFHKRHHEFKAPVGVASEYASPLEDCVVNLPSTLLPGICLGVHPIVLFIWLAVRVIETVDAHSGYALPTSAFQRFFAGPERHDFHHSHHTKGCFGALGLMDSLLGTDVHFKQWRLEQQAKRKAA